MKNGKMPFSAKPLTYDEAMAMPMRPSPPEPQPTVVADQPYWEEKHCSECGRPLETEYEDG